VISKTSISFTGKSREPVKNVVPFRPQRTSDEFKEDVTRKDLEARKRFLALEGRMRHRDSEMAALRTEPSRHLQAQESTSVLFLGRVARLEAEVLVLVSCFLKRTLLLEGGALRFMCCSYCDL
jgi:hypothetical protein